MAREKKEHKNFSCKMDARIYDELEAYCEVSRISKTAVVEEAVSRYVKENIRTMENIAKRNRRKTTDYLEEL